MIRKGRNYEVVLCGRILMVSWMNRVIALRLDKPLPEEVGAALSSLPDEVLSAVEEAIREYERTGGCRPAGHPQ